MVYFCCQQMALQLIYFYAVVMWQNVADIKKLKQAGICTIKVAY